MKQDHLAANTGLPGLDEILQGVRLGDNVVFQVDSIDDYACFAHPFCQGAVKTKKDLIYFRFAQHASLLPPGVSAHVYELNPEAGFESFLSEIFAVIEKFGKGAFYVFDCLSDLTADWYSDRMLGNFFMLTCPYLYDFDTVAYFALLRNNHTPLATDAIHRTAQVVLDIYQDNESCYVHPLKVQGRYSSMMYMLHRWEGDQFPAVVRSSETAEILSKVSQPWLDFTMQRHDAWARNFLQAQEVVSATRFDRQAAWKNSKLFRHLLRMAVTREERFLELAAKYFDFSDVVEIGKRMIGTGLIGGKSVGLLLSRAILKKEDPRLSAKLEPHDSFFIGSDVFYTYLIENQCWWMRRDLSASAPNFAGAQELQARMRAGSFPADIKNQFIEMLEYFGQSPIIVRSSSLLEDAYGNAFSGKYESVFCVNQGTPEERLESFMNAVRTVYSSAVSKDALSYRAHWGLLDQDEQMGLLVQRVSGSFYEGQYFPQIAGVGFSFNPYVWSSDIDPAAGFLRLVFGLGTRAVERVDDDYTRIIALNAPTRRPEGSQEDVRKHTQHKIDILDLKQNQPVSRSFEDVVRQIPQFPLSIFASQDESIERYARERNKADVFSWVLTFDELLSRTSFVSDMRAMMSILQKAYDYPVDIEFTMNFSDNEKYRINLLQCRPFQVKGNILSIEAPQDLAKEKVLLETKGPVIGSSLATTIDRIIYIVPEHYAKLSMADRYAVARLIGRLTHLPEQGRKLTIMLIGPGRWATSSPEMGVPVSFAEINTVSVLCEVVMMHEHLVPEVSLGTHFFNDLVEMDMLYFALHPERYDNILRSEFFQGSRNQLEHLLKDASSLSSVVRVIDAQEIPGERICLSADVTKQSAICYLGDVPLSVDNDKPAASMRK
ncbi:MAG TPA: PEP/pyruvate-binding domain-containing protein [Candidatus Omnitrophota bacterium]|nr:PEP/pyruvate-binding domain-containing protein [Candidatus Omnitrophota bacterium]